MTIDCLDLNSLVNLIATGTITPELSGEEHVITAIMNTGLVVHADYHDERSSDIITPKTFFPGDKIPRIRRYVDRLITENESFKTRTGHKGRLANLRWSVSYTE
jgi:hypothetical protein